MFLCAAAIACCNFASTLDAVAVTRSCSTVSFTRSKRSVSSTNALSPRVRTSSITARARSSIWGSKRLDAAHASATARAKSDWSYRRVFMRGDVTRQLCCWASTPLNQQSATISTRWCSGVLEMSRQTRLTPLTSLMMRVASRGSSTFWRHAVAIGHRRRLGRPEKPQDTPCQRGRAADVVRFEANLPCDVQGLGVHTIISAGSIQ